MFSFRKQDRNAAILFLSIIVLVVLLFPLLKKEGDNLNDNYPFSTQRGIKGESSNLPSLNREGAGVSLFPFDPNTADSIQLLRLGLKPWQVRNIYKYRAKGGRYRTKEDFAMLYGLTLEHYRRLEPYIKIAPEVMARDVIVRRNNENVNHSHNANANVPITPPNKKLSPGETLDINTADTTSLKRIPGIGSYFARRIVELRQRRQAFTSPDELLAIRNFPESSLVYMTCSQNFPKVHVNSSTLQQLKEHPLINHTQATDILRYRRLNGAIHSINDMALLPSFTKEKLSRIAPFLIFD
ncbi:MAG: helix-hairpin-helix domain-containing protein [Prevotella sp.]|nr:helix-hairpin-helix domain-containing protein [Prevotella sp.]